MHRDRRRRLALLVAVLTGAALFITMPAGASAKVSRTERRVVAYVNYARARHDLPPLALDRRMSAAAGSYSRRMARTGVITHGAFSQRIARASGVRQVGEVIAFLSRGTPRQASWVVSAWMHSSAHRNVILSGNFRRVGIGRARRGGMLLYTLDVAR